MKIGCQFFLFFNNYYLILHVLLGYGWTEGFDLNFERFISIRNIFNISLLSLRVCD